MSTSPSNSTHPAVAASPVNRLWLKASLVVPILVSLYLYSPSAGSYLALFEQYPPAFRVFRGIAEFILFIYCAAASLYVWENNCGGETQHLFGGGEKRSDLKDAIGPLLFASPQGDQGEYIRSISSSADDFSTVRDDGTESTDEDHDDEDVRGDEQSGDVYSPSPLSSVDAASAALDLTLMHLATVMLFTLSSSASNSGAANENTEDNRYFSLSRHRSVTYDGASTGSSHSNQIEDTVSSIAPAMVFPLILFLAVILYSFLPWKRSRKDFWVVVAFTPSAPFRSVSFRDGFIGDIMTSTVRPLQDVAFTMFYLFSGLEGWWTTSYNLDDADRPLERSWLLHTIVLPACMVSPLWWRFCQNLRQSYDSRQRWPYLGNALKYLIAAEVALFGVFNPRHQKKAVWLLAFTGATLYQIWWDIVMDWELFVAEHTDEKGHGSYSRARYIGEMQSGKGDIEMTSISSEAHGESTPSSITNSHATRIDQPSRIYIAVKPWIDYIGMYVGPGTRYRLRPRRLYKYKAMYYFICAVNILLRFCWTLSFIPPKYLTPSGKLEETFGSNIQTFINPAVASAEIIRRSLWGLLRVELEAIKRADKLSGRSDAEANKATLESTGLDGSMEPMEVKGTPTFAQLIRSDLSHLPEHTVLRELCLWATVFMSLGILAAAH
mmetsp:Transcript_7427/g.10934  ORF Transcript_7427/g.10934 Transcript_7427/m.10934 type:complete len:664 (+) Transcript_7427:70-2061(+)